MREPRPTAPRIPSSYGVPTDGSDGERYDFRAEPDEGSPVYSLRPRVAQTWLETDYPRTATRWVFD